MVIPGNWHGIPSKKVFTFIPSVSKTWAAPEVLQGSMNVLETRALSNLKTVNRLNGLWFGG